MRISPTNQISEIKSDSPQIPSGEVTLTEFSATQRAEAMQVWKQVEENCVRVPLAATSVWTETWLDHFGELIPHRFLLAKQKEKPCGMALVCSGIEQTDGPFKLKTVHLGTAGEPEADSVVVEYNSILSDENLKPAILKRMVDQLHTESLWQEFRLDGFPLEEITPLIEQQWSCNVLKRVVPSYYLDLKQVRETCAELIQAFGKSTRKNLKRNLNAAENLRCEWATTLSEAEDIFENLVQLHQQRWNSIGQPGAYASKRFLNFHRDLLVSLWSEKKVALFRVHQGNEVLGCVQLWIDDNRVYEYQSGNLGHSGKLSPGLLVDYLCMQEAMSRGFDAFDFLGGDTRHKQSLSNAQNTLIWLRFQRPNWKSFMLNLGRTFKHQARTCFQRSQSGGNS